jgi:hypothetical protein
MRRKGDQVTARFTECLVPVRIPKAIALWEIEPPNSAIPETRHDLGTVIRAPISDHQEFKTGLVLPQH